MPDEMRVYLGAASEKGQHFNTARTDMVTKLLDFKEQLLADGVIPNITDAVDNHTTRGIPHPYMTVGLVGTDIPEYVGRGGTSHDVKLVIDCQIWLHFNPMDEAYNEREKWALINSLFNYLKNTQTISTNFDGFFLGRIQGNVSFPQTGTQGAVIDFTLIKVATG